jgi:hypothetical protein
MFVYLHQHSATTQTKHIGYQKHPTLLICFLFITHQGPHTCNQFNGSNLNPHPKVYTIQIYFKKGGPFVPKYQNISFTTQIIFSTFTSVFGIIHIFYFGINPLNFKKKDPLI